MARLSMRSFSILNGSMTNETECARNGEESLNDLACDAGLLSVIIDGRLALVEGHINGRLQLGIATRFLRQKWGELRKQGMLAEAAIPST
jgi:hypothetical protein